MKQLDYFETLTWDDILRECDRPGVTTLYHKPDKLLFIKNKNDVVMAYWTEDDGRIGSFVIRKDLGDDLIRLFDIIQEVKKYGRTDQEEVRDENPA